MCAKLNRSLYGARAAPARREALYTAMLEGFGFSRGRAIAWRFYHAERDLRRMVRGGRLRFR
eukprot:1919987-Alexandrium_andersonii.AAC.1